MFKIKDAGNRANSIEMKIKDICDDEYKKNSKMGLMMSQKQFDKLVNIIINDSRFERTLRLITKQAQQNHTIGDSKRDPLPNDLVIYDYKDVLNVDRRDGDRYIENRLVKYLNKKYGSKVGWEVDDLGSDYNLSWDADDEDLIVRNITWIKIKEDHNQWK